MKSDSRGFTILELIMALALVSLLSVVVLPKLFPLLDKIRLQADARDISQALRMARQQAISTGKPTAVYIYPHGSMYRIQNGDNLPFREGVKCLDTTFGSAYGGGPPACVFYPNGAPLPRAGTVVLTNRHGEKAYIIVNPVVGRVRISGSPPSGWTD